MRHFTLLLMSLVSFSAFSQQARPDSRLVQHFSSSQLSNMDEHRIAYWNYYLDHSFIIMDIADEKSTELAHLEEVEVDLEAFHGFTMELDPYQKEGAYLRIKDLDKMLVIKPMAQFLEEFNSYYQSK